MKKIFLILVLLVSLTYSTPSYPWGVITHIGLAQDVINKAKAEKNLDPAMRTIPSDIASIISKDTKTERAFRSGALDGDVFNALIGLRGLDPNDLNRQSHEQSAAIARALLNNAKTDIEKAYAYGWALNHLPADVVGHGDYVYSQTNAHWDYDSYFFKGTNGEHVGIEYQADWYVLSKFGFDEYEYTDPDLGVTSTIKMEFPRLSRHV